jgi:hypothetical protein
MLLGTVLAALFVVLPASVGIRSGVSRLDDHVLDPAARGVITFGNTANVASYQQEAILSYHGWQYTAWYHANRRAVIARRKLPTGRWQRTKLGIVLQADDSHNTIALAVTPSDGRLHAAFPTHDGPIRYTRTRAGVADRPSDVEWTSSRLFEHVHTSWPGAPDAPTSLTYPRFELVRDRMLLTYRKGRSADGEQVLLRYDDSRAGTWTHLGSYTSRRGRYASPYGTSTHRSAYLHGFTADPRSGDLAITWTWREDPRIWCTRAGIGNHDIGYAVSHDSGTTWNNNAGRVIGRTGTNDSIGIDDPHVVLPIPIGHGLINQEAQAFDHRGRLHVMSSRVPASVVAQRGGCVRDFYPERRRFARPYHAWRDNAGTWHETRLPARLDSSGRSKLVFDRDDTGYAILPDARIMAATAASRWTDWQTVFAAPGTHNVSELTIDRSRIALDGVLTIGYQEPPTTPGAPSAYRIPDFRLGGVP